MGVVGRRVPARVRVEGDGIEAQEPHFTAFFGGGARMADDRPVTEVNHAVPAGTVRKRVPVKHEVAAFSSAGGMAEVDAVVLHEFTGVGHADELAGFNVARLVTAGGDAEHAAADVGQRITWFCWRAFP